MMEFEFKRFAIALLILTLYFPSPGQKLLFHKNRYKEVFYQVGDHISFRKLGSTQKISGEIIGFEDSLIVFKEFKVNPKVISHMYVDDKTKQWFILRYKYRGLVFIGIGYLAIDVINTGELSKSTAIVSASLVGAGLLAKWIIADRIKIKGRRKLVIFH